MTTRPPRYKNMSQAIRDHKEGIMITTACVMLASGICLSFLSFSLDLAHEVDDSVLWYFAQTIVYASSVFGIGAYVNYKIKGISMINNQNEITNAKQDR